MQKQTLITLAITLLSTPAFAGSYRTTTVKDPGTLQGSITYKGKAKISKISVTKDNKTCGKDVVDESLLVSSSGGLANAVVYFSDIKAGAEAKKESLTLDQKSCVYVPHVQASTVNSSLKILNSDAVLHNVHAYGDAGSGRTLFNLAMPIKGQKLTKSLKKPGIFSMKCDAGHTWMSAYVYVFEHPYFAVTKKDGSFSIDNIPAGTYKVTIWHEKLGETTQSVTINKGSLSTLTLEMK